MIRLIMIIVIIVMIMMIILTSIINIINIMIKVRVCVYVYVYIYIYIYTHTYHTHTYTHTAPAHSTLVSIRLVASFAARPTAPHREMERWNVTERRRDEKGKGRGGRDAGIRRGRKAGAMLIFSAPFRV